MLRWIKDKLANRGMILMYHQVAQLPCDPWQLAVNPENFEAHLHVLKKNYHVVPLLDLAAHLNTTHAGKRLIAITFDDGYLDNLHSAAPLLIKYNLPATFFIATGLIGTDNLFWWDELAHLILLQNNLPQQIELQIDTTLYFEFNDDASLSEEDKEQIKNWNSTLPFPNKRIELFYKIWEQLKVLTIEKRSRVLSELRQQIGVQKLSPGPAQVMNVEQLKQLSHNPLFTIGAHTINHPALSVLSLQDQITEIEMSKTKIENWLDLKVNTFAYPYGNYDATTLEVMKSSSFRLAVTTESKLVKRSTHAYEMPRYQVINLNEQQFSQQLNSWFKSNPS